MDDCLPAAHEAAHVRCDGPAGNHSECGTILFPPKGKVFLGGVEFACFAKGNGFTSLKCQGGAYEVL